jgi:isocitrate dehydrogenase
MTDTNSKFRIAVLPGDGIGQEVMTPCLEVIDAALQRGGGGGGGGGGSEGGGGGE